MQNDPKQTWRHLASRIDAMTLRERALVFLALAAVSVALIVSLLLDPLVAKQKKLSGEAAQQQAQMAAIQAQIQALASSRQVDPDAAMRLQLKELKQRLEQSDKTLEKLQLGLVSPDKAAQLLEGILEQNRGLRLVSLKILPVASVVEASTAKKAEKASASAGQVYQHGIRISVEGSYADLLRYVSALEKLPWRMFWAQADLRVEEHPKAVLTLTVYTLSLDKSWLAV